MYIFWWENPEGIRPLGRHIQIWENNIKMCLEGKEGIVCSLFAFSKYGAVVGPCRHSDMLLGSVKCRKYFEELSSGTF